MPCLVIIVGGRASLNTWYSSQPGLGDPRFKPASMPTVRWRLAAAPLGAGVVGAFGGFNGVYYRATNEIYDHSMNTWTTRASMPTARGEIAAAPLGLGLVGVFGGTRSTDILVTTEVYNYFTNTWASRASMPTGRRGLAAAPLGPGLAGVFGGLPSGNLTEVYDYSANSWTVRASMPTARRFLTSAPLGPGLAGVFGGIGLYDDVLATNEIYNHDANAWTRRASMPTARFELAAGSLGSGLAGVFGGRYSLYSDLHVLPQNEAYDYYSDTWLTRAPMPTARSGIGVAELDYGVVAVVGGFSGGDTNEIYVY
jgi:hypothetical protein